MSVVVVCRYVAKVCRQVGGGGRKKSRVERSNVARGRSRGRWSRSCSYYYCGTVSCLQPPKGKLNGHSVSVRVWAPSFASCVARSSMHPLRYRFEAYGARDTTGGRALHAKLAFLLVCCSPEHCFFTRAL